MCITITVERIRSFDDAELGELVYELIGLGNGLHLEPRRGRDLMDTAQRDEFFPPSSKYSWERAEGRVFRGARARPNPLEP